MAELRLRPSSLAAGSMLSVGGSSVSSRAIFAAIESSSGRTNLRSGRPYKRSGTSIPHFLYGIVSRLRVGKDTDALGQGP
jgi:hypothetical protein